MVDRGCDGGPRCSGGCARLLGEAPRDSSQLLGRDGTTTGNVISLGLLRGKPSLDLGLPGLDDDDIFDVVLPLGGIVSEQVRTGRAQWRSGVSSSAPMTVISVAWRSGVSASDAG